MGLVQKSISGLYRGVSRQDKTNRIEGQVQESINMMHSIEKGVSRRNPTELVKKLPDTLNDQHAFVHAYSRGDSDEEKYIVYVTDTTIRVFKAKDGEEITVNIEDNASDYLKLKSGKMAHESFKALTVGDTTFIVNRDVTCAMSDYTDDIERIDKLHPFYWIKRSFDNGSGEGYDYTLNGKTVNATNTQDAVNKLYSALASGTLDDNIFEGFSKIIDDGLEAFRTSVESGTSFGTSHENFRPVIGTAVDKLQVDTASYNISNDVFVNLKTTLLREEYNIYRYWKKKYGGADSLRTDGYIKDMQRLKIIGSDTILSVSTIAGYRKFGSIIIANSTPSKWEWSDSYGSQASQGVWGSVQKIRDLPNTLSGADSVYNVVVKIQGDPDNKYTSYWVRFEDEHWKETREPVMRNNIDNSTMPIKLVREADGTFSLSKIDYQERLVGDEDTAPEPSFIGQTIQDVFFFKNRLCFISGENVIMSRVSDFYSFFPKTVTDVLDSDPIDVSVDSNNVALLNHAIPFNDSVVLLSDNSQFALSADKVISPNDVSVSATTNYTCDEYIAPVALGNSVYFISKGLQDVSLREYYVDSTGTSNIAVDVSRHVGNYVPNHLINMLGNSNQNILFTLSDTARDTLYVYKYFNDGNERIQTAWFKWVFGGTIYNIALMEDYLYLIIDRGDGVQLERLNYNASDTQPIYMDNGNISYTSSLELSEIVLKDSNGVLIQSAKSPIMYKTFILTSTDNSDYQVRIENKLRTRSAKGFAKRDNKVMVQGKTNETKITVKSVSSKPLEFHTYTFELNYNLRAGLV